jgi:hypothetical protein
VLFLGRVAGGIGTSLLFSAPEAWMVGEHSRRGLSSLGKMFGLAYFGDAIVAMGAGQLAQASATVAGPTAPFTVSTVFLALGALLAALFWQENKGAAAAAPPAPAAPAAADAPAAAASATQKERGTDIGRAAAAMVQDPRIMLVGLVQSLFEGAMYIFVLQWPRAFMQVVPGAAVPFGRIFSGFMAACMLGSSLFPALCDRGVRVEDSVAAMLGLAVAAMATAAAFGGTGLGALVGSLFAFEACVGFYFPSIGTLRSRYLPDAHRSIIMNLFGIPLNLIVVAVYLQVKRLGTNGALWCSAASLTLSFAAALALRLSKPTAATQAASA